MAEATNFPESNLVLNPPEGVSPDDCFALCVWRGLDQVGQPVVISCWKITEAELKEVIKTGRIWLWWWGTTMAPSIVSCLHPWEGKPDKIREGTIIPGTVKDTWLFDPIPTLAPGEQLQTDFITGKWRIIKHD
jgi:hypothetical protein